MRGASRCPPSPRSRRPSRQGPKLTQAVNLYQLHVPAVGHQIRADLVQNQLHVLLRQLQRLALHQRPARGRSCEAEELHSLDDGRDKAQGGSAAGARLRDDRTSKT